MPDSKSMRRIVTGTCWLYLVACLGLWMILRVTGDRWWLATVFLFGPRWVCLLPLLVLIPAALLVCRRSLWVILAGSWILLFPVMGLCLPWRLLVPDGHNGPRIRVLDCNLRREKADALAVWISSVKPDVVAVQEWNAQSRGIAVEQGNTHCLTNGELYLASRYPIRKVEDLAGRTAPVSTVAVCYEIDTPWGKVPFVNLHLASPREALEAVRWCSSSAPAEVRTNSAMRLKQSQVIGQCAAGLGPAVLLAGDFNTPDGSSILRGCWAAFSDAFSVAGWGFGHTYYSRRVSSRIDRIMNGSSWRCRGCLVGPDVGSPHRPIIAELEFVGTDR